MSDEEKPLSDREPKRAAGKARRARLIEWGEIFCDLLMSGYSASQIAKATKMSEFTVRRAIDRTLAEELFTRLPVARLMEALRCEDLSLDKGDMEAIANFLKVVAELDRYRRLVPARRLAPRTPLALTHAPAASAIEPSPTPQMCAKAHLNS